MVGVRYAYAYLWYLEPRFKMQYGTYLTTAPWGRVLLHLSGGVGAPLACFAGALVLANSFPVVAGICWTLFWIMALIQIVAFTAEWIGLRRIGPLRLSLLTSPATAAMELKSLLTKTQK